MISFREYLWEKIRKPMWGSWCLLVILSVCAYSVIVFFLKARQLDSSLKVAIFTVNQSIQAGDWSLALGHLQELEKAGPVFDITLRSVNGSQNVSGPFGEHPFGLGTFCSEKSTEHLWVLRGCMRVLGWTEIYTLGLFVVFAFLVFGIAFWLVRSKSLFFIGKISDELEEMQRESTSVNSDEPIVEINAIRQHILGLRKQTEQASRTKAFTELSVQVAHDIRSPLAALDMVVKDSAVLPESDRLLVRTAVSRITDIANNLINQYSLVPELRGASSPSRGPVDAHLLSPVIENVASEKRMQYRSRIGIEILAKADPGSYGLFASIETSEFKRVLSNLINNSVEAIEGIGQISITLSNVGDQVEVAITDTGKGIPGSILPQLMKKGASFGKEGGTGLGLYHAKETVESWGGAIHLESREGTGTTVRLLFPKAQSPDWFVSELAMEPGQTVVVLDDDPSIHQVWDGRLHSLAEQYGIETVHFSAPAQFTEWLKKTPAGGRSLFLIDYELLGSKTTGLELIESLGIADSSVLVTSRYEDDSIRERCKRLHVKLIPKSIAAYVPIAVQPTCAVLIDDDPIIHQIWGRAARAAGRNLSSFSSVDEFLSHSSDFDSETPVYLDSHLGNGARGETLAKEIRAQGFSRIYLVTGFAKKDLAPTPDIRAIMDKNPPWSA